MGIICSKKQFQPKQSSQLKKIELLDYEMQFDVVQKNFKGKNVQKDASYIQINYSNYFEKKSLMIFSSNPNYQIYGEFKIKINTKKLRSENLTIKFYDGKNTYNGNIINSQYDLATGPIHNDFVINSKSRYLGRISYDVIMTQSVTFGIQCKQLESTFYNQPSIDKFFNYSLVCQNAGKRIESKHSSDFERKQINVPEPALVYGSNIMPNLHNIMESLEDNEDKSFEVQDIDFNSPIKERLSNNNPNISIGELEMGLRSTSDPRQNLHQNPEQISISTKNIKSEHPKLAWQGFPAPYIEFEAFVKQFHDINMMICIWGRSDPDQQFDEEQNYFNGEYEDENFTILDHKLRGIGYLNQFKLQHEEELKHVKDFEKNLEMRLWHHGKEVGKIKAKAQINHCPFVRQLKAGVRTEEGVNFNSILLAKNGRKGTVKDSQLPKGISELKRLQLEAEETCFYLYDKLSDNEDQKNIKEYTEQDLNDLLLKIIQNLKNGNLIYNSEAELQFSQEILCNFGIWLVNLLDDVDESNLYLFYNCLRSLLVRQEFKLSSMAFDQEYKPLLKQGGEVKLLDESSALSKKQKNLKLKNKTCVLYQKFMLLVLKFCQSKINNDHMIEREKNFLCVTLTIQWFRIPTFREKVIALQPYSENHQNLVQDIDNFITSRNLEYHRDKFNIFEWNSEFYVYLKNFVKAEENFEMLDEILVEKGWQNIIKKRGQFMLDFISEWATYVDTKILKEHHLSHYDIPGYSHIIKSCIIELIEKDIRHFGEGMIRATSSQIQNSNVIIFFMQIIYKKTNIYDSVQVYKTFELLNTWFGVLKKSRSSLPPGFDYDQFLEGIFVGMRLDTGVSQEKVLWFLYNNFSFQPTMIKLKFWDQLVEDHFTNLFLHWSYNIRNLFYRFLNFTQKNVCVSNLSQNTDPYEIRKKLILSNDSNKQETQGLVYSLIYYEIKFLIESLQIRLNKQIEFEKKNPMDKVQTRKERLERKKQLFQKKKELNKFDTPRKSSFDVDELVSINKTKYSKFNKPLSQMAKGKNEKNSNTNSEIQKKYSETQDDKVIINKNISLKLRTKGEMFIPKNQEVYLKRACKEYLVVEGEYNTWYRDVFQKTCSKVSKDLLENFKKFPNVPEVFVVIPKDDYQNSFTQEADEDMKNLTEFTLKTENQKKDDSSEEDKIDTSKSKSNKSKKR